MQKSETKISMGLNVSVEQAWKVISSIDGVEKWFPSVIKSCQYENGKRYCETNDGITLVEHILELNHEQKVFKFSIPAQTMLPVSDIEEIMQVRQSEKGETIVDWSGTWLVDIENEQFMIETFSNLWSMGLKEMETYILTSKN
ncbi:MAG TPA: SRPBCC family protein [Saprospiraceae bacterium]|nr:SRPBCC family protein [Saprospiraceae bacterium]